MHKTSKDVTSEMYRKKKGTVDMWALYTENLEIVNNPWKLIFCQFDDHITNISPSMFYLRNWGCAEGK